MNGETITTTPTHPFYVPQKGWTEAAKLRAGDILVTCNGEYVVVEQVQHELLETPITVYNFEVEDFHTYYVAANEDAAFVLVHNRCGQTSADKKPTQAQREIYGEAHRLDKSKTNLSYADAESLVNRAREAGIKAHPPMTHTGRSGYWSDKLHIKVGKYHIRVKE